MLVSTLLPQNRLQEHYEMTKTSGKKSPGKREARITRSKQQEADRLAAEQTILDLRPHAVTATVLVHCIVMPIWMDTLV